MTLVVMSIWDAWNAAHVAEAVLGGKQPIEPIIAELQSTVADAQLALGHLAKALEGLKALNAEIQAASISQHLRQNKEPK